MDIRLSVDTAQLDQWANLATKRLPQGAAYAINHTVDRVRTEKLFPWIRSRLIMRTPESEQFFFGVAAEPDGKAGYFGGAAGRFPRADRARVGRLWAEFGVESIVRRGSKGGELLLSGLVTGGQRKPATPGAKSIAVPLEGRPARPSIRRPVPPAFQVANLRLQAYYHGAKIVRRTRGRHVRGQGLYGSDGRANLSGVQGLQWKGLQRTFLLPHTKNAPLGAIFQRFERGRAGIRELYTFVPPFALPKRLGDYEALVQREAPAIFREEMELALQKAIGWEAESLLRRMAA